MDSSAHAQPLLPLHPQLPSATAAEDAAIKQREHSEAPTPVPGSEPNIATRPVVTTSASAVDSDDAALALLSMMSRPEPAAGSTGPGRSGDISRLSASPVPRDERDSPMDAEPARPLSRMSHAGAIEGSANGMSAAPSGHLQMQHQTSHLHVPLAQPASGMPSMADALHQQAYSRPVTPPSVGYTPQQGYPATTPPSGPASRGGVSPVLAGQPQQLQPQAVPGQYMDQHAAAAAAAAAGAYAYAYAQPTAFAAYPGMPYAYPYPGPPQMYAAPGPAGMPGQNPASPSGLVAVVVPTAAWAAAAAARPGMPAQPMAIPAGPGGQPIVYHYMPGMQPQQMQQAGGKPPAGYAGYPPPIFPMTANVGPISQAQAQAQHQQFMQRQAQMQDMQGRPPSGLVLPPPNMIVDEASSPDTDIRTSPSEASPVSSTLYPDTTNIKAASDTDEINTRRRRPERAHKRNLSAATAAWRAANPNPPSRETRVFQCEICKKVLKSSGHYHRHRREVHEKKRDYVCGVCNEAFSRQEHLSRHMSSHERGTTAVIPSRATYSTNNTSPGLSASSYGSSPRSMISMETGPSPVLAPLPPLEDTSAAAAAASANDGRSAFGRTRSAPVKREMMDTEESKDQSPMTAVGPGEHQPYWRDSHTQ